MRIGVFSGDGGLLIDWEIPAYPSPSRWAPLCTSTAPSPCPAPNSFWVLHSRLCLGHLLILIQSSRSLCIFLFVVKISWSFCLFQWGLGNTATAIAIVFILIIWILRKHDQNVPNVYFNTLTSTISTQSTQVTNSQHRILNAWVAPPLTTHLNLPRQVMQQWCRFTVTCKLRCHQRSAQEWQLAQKANNPHRTHETLKWCCFQPLFGGRDHLTGFVLPFTQPSVPNTRSQGFVSQGEVSWDTGYWVLEGGHTMPRKSMSPSGTPQKSLLGGPGPGWPRSLAPVESFWTTRWRRIREQINGHASSSSAISPLPPQTKSCNCPQPPHSPEGRGADSEPGEHSVQTSSDIATQGTEESCPQQHLPWTQSTGLHYPLFFCIRCHEPFSMFGIQERLERTSLSSKNLSS